MSATSTVAGTGDSLPKEAALPRQEQTLLLFKRLLEGGKEDDDTVGVLDQLTKLINDDVEATQRGEPPVCAVIDSGCANTLIAYLDIRQPSVVRGHATLTTSAYLQAAGDEGAAQLAALFYDRVARTTDEDLITAFCVAAAVIPIVPDLTANNMFLNERFLSTLGPLIRRTWKSRNLETACLEMLNVACKSANCLDAVAKHCSDWLQEIIDQEPNDVIKAIYARHIKGYPDTGPDLRRHHSPQVRDLAEEVLIRIKRKGLPPVSDEDMNYMLEPVAEPVSLWSQQLTRPEPDQERPDPTTGVV